ncbi:hypothetical protein C943_03318 [Mariniradius saccharolyticus AK6]|uniref:Uncharacterized protein n=1 Tax=Mariniradius saccharolyticus AK6 TaxID=1239962 RepID=M7YBR5_9BACT|nr:hypothetical protein [Mariniradius saccharolyticus]EMS34631.1 hypothetical protein C943_03318 [Mariniradius saccharolyticus AK6]
MTFEDLLALATVVRDESTDEANTALRIGSLLLNIINKMSEIETTPGESPELRTSGEFVQTKLPSGVSWINLYNKNVAFQKTDTYIQWKFGDGSWVNLVALSEITGSNGLSAYQIALLNGFVGTSEEWLESLQGQDGSPDTAAQIRDKINTLTGEDRLAVAVLKDFVTAVLGQIQTEVPARSSQFSSGPIAELETLYLNSTQFTITFEKHRIYGSRNLPIYALLNIVFTDAKPTIKTIVTHSGPWSPSIFADVYATSSGNYSSTSAMLADQASQTVNLIYRVGTTYWKYRGTTTGILETDYKQIRIVYKGSAYLTGLDNVNVLTFEYKDTHQEGGEVITDVVVVENIAITNGNLDPAKPDLDNIIRLGFNDNLNNTSWWASHINLEITDDASSDFIDLGGGDFSFRTCTNNNNSTGGVIIATISDQLREAMANASRITVLLRVRRVSPTSATTVFHFGIMSPDGSLGLRTEFDITNSRLGTRIKGGNYRSASSSLVFQQAEWIEVAFQYDPTLGSNHMKFFARAAGYSPAIPMSLIGQVNVTQPRPFFESGVTNIYFNVEANGIGRRNNVEYDWCDVILNKTMALADIEARFDANNSI